MDANGTHYHLLLGREDWGACLDPLGNPLRDGWEGLLLQDLDNHLAWDASRDQLTLEPLLFLYVASPQDVSPNVTDRRGAGCDRYGNWYWIDATNRKVRVHSVGSKQPSDFWPLAQPACPPPPNQFGFQPVQNRSEPATLVFSGLAVTEDHYLVVGVLDPPSLLVFDLHAGRPPEQLFWPEGVDFIPFDMAPRPGGGVWILDRQNHRYWALDRNFDLVSRDQQVVQISPGRTETFQDAGAESDQRKERLPVFFPLGISLEDSSPLDVDDPIAIEALPDCSVLILDRSEGEKFSEISRYRFNLRLGKPVSTSAMQEYVEESRQADFSLLVHDFTCLGAQVGSDGAINCQLHVASTNGNQAFAFELSGTETGLVLSPLPDEYLPMRLFSGKGLVACGGLAFYDMDERWLPLVPQSRPRYHTQATLSRIFDGHQPDCTWHRLMLDACIPPDCTVVIESRAANQKDDLSAQAWRNERLYRRGDGSELPFAPNIFQPVRSVASLSLAPDEARPTAPTGSGTWELLFQNARGRYLQLRLTLEGQGQRTPRLRALRAYYPRFSYLEHYLPAVYRQEPESASFLDRFLANVEGCFTAAEDKIAAVRLLFDVDSAPPEALDWLADWLGVALDPAWDDYRRRLFIRHAIHFFQFRGTSYGLRMALHLALDKCPSEDIFADPGTYSSRPGALRIVESFCNRPSPAGSLTGQSAFLSTRSSYSPPVAYWQPLDGAVVLNKCYRAAVGTSSPYPLRDPGGDLSPAWQDFSLRMLGFVPAADPSKYASLWQEHLAQWRKYLALRYGTLDAFNQAYHLSDQDRLYSFEQAQPPTTLPADGEPLEDWYHFETFYVHHLPAGSLTSQPASPSTCSPSSPPVTHWQPADGSAVLNKRYQEVEAGSPYRLQDPGGDLSLSWQAFSSAMLGFVPATDSAMDCFLWRDYLAQRYGTLDAYNQAYRLSGQDQLTSFDQAQIPRILPTDGEPVKDWHRFETVLLPMARQAHQFSVLLPIPADAGPGSDEFQRRVNLACRIIDLEKPAHTIYNIKFFWAMFRVGDARLGLDTLLDLGSRSPHWLPPLVLGQGYLAESTLATSYPFDIADRLVLQRGCTSGVSSGAPAGLQDVIKSRTILKRSDDCWARRRRSSQL